MSEDKLQSELNIQKASEESAPEEVKIAFSGMIADKPKKKFGVYQVLQLVFTLGFVIFTGLLINETLITPYRINHSIQKTKALHISSSNTSQASNIRKVTAIPTPDPNRDSQGRLLQFKNLLAANEDVKGWITIPDSNIDYVVMQSGTDDPEFYLNRDMDKKELKAGSLFLDYKSSVETSSKNLTIHGHNMTSTDNMFHYLIKYKEPDYYKERPIITFDTIYQTGKWKIFAVFITNGTSDKEDLFNYTLADFHDTSAFLNFIYQLRIRSIYQIDNVDIKENDQLLTLSTCSYEVKNYRTVIVARRVREGENEAVDVNSVTINPEPLYPDSYYYRYGGKAPELPSTFEEALSEGVIHWYTAVE